MVRPRLPAILLLGAVGKAASLLSSFLTNGSGPSSFLVSPWLSSRPGKLWDAIAPPPCWGSWERNYFQKLVTARKGRPWWSGPVQGLAPDYFSSSSKDVCLDAGLLLTIPLSFLLQFSAGFSILFLSEATSVKRHIRGWGGRLPVSVGKQREKTPSQISQVPLRPLTA